MTPHGGLAAQFNNLSRLPGTQQVEGEGLILQTVLSPDPETLSGLCPSQHKQNKCLSGFSNVKKLPQFAFLSILVTKVIMSEAN